MILKVSEKGVIMESISEEVSRKPLIMESIADTCLQKRRSQWV